MGAAVVPVNEHVDGMFAAPYIGQSARMMCKCLVLVQQLVVMAFDTSRSGVVSVEFLLIDELSQHCHESFALRL